MMWGPGHQKGQVRRRGHQRRNSFHDRVESHWSENCTVFYDLLMPKLGPALCEHLRSCGDAPGGGCLTRSDHIFNGLGAVS